MNDRTRRRDKLVAAVQPQIHELIHCRFTTKLIDGELDAHDVLRIFRQYRFYCASFPQLLGCLLARIDSELIRRPLIINLWEESGEGDLTKTHLQMLDRFLSAWSSAIGVVPTVHEKTRDPVSIFVSQTSSYLREASLAAAFGFIGPGTEGVTSQQYEIFLQGLRAYGLVAEKDLQFFSTHVEADVRHTDLFWESLYAVCLDDEGAWLDAERGALESLKIESNFWSQVLGTL